MSPGPVLGMVLKGYPRISETFISNEIGLLESQGFRIHIFSMRKPREAFSHKSVKRIKAEVTYLPSTLLTSLPRFLIPNLRAYLAHPVGYWDACKLMVKKLKLSRRAATIKHLFQAGYLVSRMKGKGIGRLHAHFAHSPTSVAQFASTICKVPFSFTAHAKDIYTQRPGALIEKLALADFTVTCTGYNQRHLESLAPRGKHIHRVYHGIDTSLFAANGRPTKAEPPYYIVSVARLVEKKGLPMVLEALALLKRKGLDFRYVLIGDGDDRRKIQALIRRLGLAECTQTTGTIAHHQVIEHYRRADLFVLGCVVAENGDRDGIPNVLMESMAMGVPVTATEVSAIPELVTDGETGLLVPPADAEALARAMERLLTDQKLRERVIPAARKRVIEDFDNRALIAELGRIYERAGIGPQAQA